MEMRGSVFYIYLPFEVTGTFKPADNIAEFDVANTLLHLLSPKAYQA